MLTESSVKGKAIISLKYPSRRPGVAIGGIPGGLLINWAILVLLSQHKGRFTQDAESASHS